MKKKVGELYDKPIVVGNPNEVNKDEILLKNSGGGITLSERKDGELETITNEPPKEFRYIICYKETEIYNYLKYLVFIPSADTYLEYEGIITPKTEYSSSFIISNQKDSMVYDNNDNPLSIDEMIKTETEKGNIKEISQKEFFGYNPYGVYYRLKLEDFIEGDEEIIYNKVNNYNDIKRIKYLKDNIDKAKYNHVGFSYENRTWFYTIVNNAYIENNYIVFETEKIPPFMVSKIKVSLDAEVVNK